MSAAQTTCKCLMYRNVCILSYGGSFSVLVHFSHEKFPTTRFCVTRKTPALDEASVCQATITNIQTNFRIDALQKNFVTNVRYITYLFGKGKGKVRHRTDHEVPEGEWIYNCTLSVTWDLSGQSRPQSASPPGKTQCPLYVRLGRPQGRPGRVFYIKLQSNFIYFIRNGTLYINLLNPTCQVIHQQFNVQQLYALPTLYLCVLYLSENKQRLVPLTA